MNADGLTELRNQLALAKITLNDYQNALRDAFLAQGEPEKYDELTVFNMTVPELEVALQPYLMLDHQRSDEDDPYDADGEQDGQHGDSSGEGGEKSGDNTEGEKAGGESEPDGESESGGSGGVGAGKGKEKSKDDDGDGRTDRDNVKALFEKKRKDDQEAAEEKRRQTQEELEKMQQKADEHAAMDDVMHMLGTVRCCLLVGPTGTGKSTLAKNACRKLFHVDDPIQSGKYAQISFSPDTTSGELIGRSDVNGKFHESEVVRVFRDGGLILFDEIDDADASMLIKVNTALANGYLSTPNGMVTRHRDAYVVCSANTFGTGPDAMYVGRSRLDAATLDRFTLATVYVDYDVKLESRIAGALPANEANQLIDFVCKVRTVIRDGHLRRACSTRFVINAVSHVAAGKDMKWVRENFLLGWKENERNKIDRMYGKE